ncbi:hypothetical protein [Idiomarina xiamenensis]|uniref:DUF4440 domain-containing protein n=1 Tax=Idiomarina xiamenensis 10-D-4 TaxID=740709 RepID=K2KCM4_9GAMM|nr:hypothetical protein [Idiomarina xiamenensis]EKE84427.1 hypothetical protein A10D4_05147 [Idiomarina xiamenensis 10-D-4]
MQAVKAEGLIAEDDVDTWYKADDIQIRFYDNVALLTFILIAQPSAADQAAQRFFNSGVLVQRDGHWQAVNWQATVAH